MGSDDLVQYPDVPFPLEPSLVLLARRGSESHGTYVPSTDPNSIDDRDLIGVCIPPASWTIGLRAWEGAESIKGEWDVVLYDYRKCVRLLCKQNPNMISMLWLEHDDYLRTSPEGQALLRNRNLFRAREPAYASFCGYARAQIKKMELGVFRGYMGERRKSLVKRVGYDAKNAAHAVRLLHMGIEYLRTGTLTVRRTWDRDMLLEIKRGEWPLSQVKSYVDSRMDEIDTVYANSDLPETIDMEAVEAIVIEAMRGRLEFR